MISVSLGVLLFLLMLFTAAQLLFALHLSSVADAAAYDAARIVARSGAADDAAARSRAAAHARGLLGDAREVEVSFAGTTADAVVVTVSARPPTLVGTSFGIPLLDRVEGGARLTIEDDVEVVP